jgi:outer membrane receptor for ferric coprogen and ferric-rhodotorulic acid
MTGKQLYKMYREIRKDYGLKSKKWKKLNAHEIEVFNTLAMKIDNGHKPLMQVTKNENEVDLSTDMCSHSRNSIPEIVDSNKPVTSK